MNFGFNHNIDYNGEVYHVQTEDGGAKNPVVTTQVFKAGVVVASVKTGYSDIIESGKFEEAVRDLMRKQHLGAVADLKAGRFSEK